VLARPRDHVGRQRGAHPHPDAVADEGEGTGGRELDVGDLAIAEASGGSSSCGPLFSLGILHIHPNTVEQPARKLESDVCALR
jgi:hypothetical protein